jgi:hypothetical protein
MKIKITIFGPFNWLLLSVFTLVFTNDLYGQSFEWPILKHYDQEHIHKIALPVGGIGTGTISLGGTGNNLTWRYW